MYEYDRERKATSAVAVDPRPSQAALWNYAVPSCSVLHEYSCECHKVRPDLLCWDARTAMNHSAKVYDGDAPP